MFIEDNIIPLSMMKLSYLRLSTFTGSYKNLRYKVQKVPIVIGLTGMIGSGKSEVINILAKKYKIYKISSDDLAKELLKKNKYEYVNNDNFLQLSDINDIKENFHPIVWKEAKKIIDKTKNIPIYDIIIMETALPSDVLFEITDTTICIKNNIDIKKKLLRDNRHYTDNKIDTILNIQNNYNEFYDKCEYIIDNNLTFDDLEKKIFDIKLEIKLALFTWNEDISFDNINKNKISSYYFTFDDNGINNCKNKLSELCDK